MLFPEDLFTVHGMAGRLESLGIQEKVTRSISCIICDPADGSVSTLKCSDFPEHQS